MIERTRELADRKHFEWQAVFKSALGVLMLTDRRKIEKGKCQELARSPSVLPKLKRMWGEERVGDLGHGLRVTGPRERPRIPGFLGRSSVVGALCKSHDAKRLKPWFSKVRFRGHSFSVT